MESGRFGRTLCFGRLVQPIVEQLVLELPISSLHRSGKTQCCELLVLWHLSLPQMFKCWFSCICGDGGAEALASLQDGNSYAHGQVLYRAPGFVQPVIITSWVPWSMQWPTAKNSKWQVAQRAVALTYLPTDDTRW